MLYYIEKDGKTVTEKGTEAHPETNGEPRRMFAVDPESNSLLRKDDEGVWEYNQSPSAVYGEEDWLSMKEGACST